MSNRNSTNWLELSPEKSALLEALLREKNATSSADRNIRQRAHHDSASASFFQQRLWFLDKMLPDSPVYNIPVKAHISGTLDVEILNRSINAVIQRHEILRTTFATHEGKPVQVINPEMYCTMPVTDLRETGNAVRQARATEITEQEAQQAFDLEKGPLLRCTLLRLQDNEYFWLVTLHHIICGAWSVTLFFREVSAHYRAYTEGRTSPLPELSIQYGDFSEWQHQQLQNNFLDKQLSYWKQKLGGSLPVLQLPTDHPRPAVSTGRGAFCSLILPEALATEIKNLSTAEGVTQFMYLLAVFKVLLFRYTNQRDILVGIPISGRQQTELEPLIGCFVNTLVMRTKPSDRQSFRDFLKQVRETALEAYSHQNVPFEHLVETLQPERTVSYNPLFQAMFLLHGEAADMSWSESLSLPQTETGLSIVRNNSSKVDLTLEIEKVDDGLLCIAEYSTDLFDEATINRFLNHYQALLESIVSEPDQLITRLPLLSGTEHHQQLVEWNNTQTDFPEEHCVHELFEAQVKQTPDAIATQFDEKTLTYRELNNRANQLACYLRKNGVSTEVCVGICIERSQEMLVALLGILKAGGVYVPLDPDYPKERLALMFNDSQVSVLVTQKRLKSKLPGHNAKVVYIDRDSEKISDESQQNPGKQTISGNLAYVIYTSGSTGKPKGVAVSHQAISRLVFNTNFIKFDRSDRVAQASNASFDAATFEIWGALLHGACLVGVPTDVALTPGDFARYIREQKISVLFLTTALFNQLVRESPSVFQSVRHLLFGGEEVDPRRVGEVLKHGPPDRLLHVYGPTENTTFTSWYQVKDIRKGSTVPIGRPLSNSQIYVLDQNLQPVPVGVSGELYIGGRGLAQGYLNRPELTAERFIPDPYSSVPGARLYMTGDRVRYLADGNIEYIGRIDKQVKIRGFRIEPGEIEVVLSQHPDVQQTAVMAREDSPGNRRLVAYIASDNDLTISDLRSFLKQKLPRYMLPSVYVTLDTLPLTDNGKVNYQALPEPDNSRAQAEEKYVAPGNNIETQLVEIWEKVLGVKSIGIKDDFFELGGHSLLSVQLLTEIEQEYGKRIPLAHFFQAPTIAHTAKEILHREKTADTSSLIIPIQPQGSRRPLFFAPGGGGSEAELVLGYGRLTRHLGTDQPFYGLRARGTEGEEEIQSHTREIAADLLKEMRTIQPEGPYLLGGGCVGGVIAFEIAQQLREKGEEVEMLLLMESVLPSSMIYRYFQALTLKNSLVRKWRNQRMMVQRLLHHARNLPRMASERRFQYLLEKVGNVKKLRAENKTQNETKQMKKNYQRTLFRYTPEPYSGRITLLVAEDEPHTDPYLGWETLAKGGIDVHKIPGDHISHLEVHYKATAKQLKACLDAARTIH